MRRLRRLSRGGRLLLALAVSGGVFGIATAVQASIPDAQGVIHGCYNTSLAHGSPTGAVRVVDTSKLNGACASWEAPLNWNQRGPTGPAGPSYSGLVSGTGQVIVGTGNFTVTHNGTGSYTVSFPAGTLPGFCSDPIPTVTPTAGVAAGIELRSFGCGSDGSGSFTIEFRTVPGGVLFDTEFTFVAVPA